MRNELSPLEPFPKWLIADLQPYIDGFENLSADDKLGLVHAVLHVAIARDCEDLVFPLTEEQKRGKLVTSIAALFAN